MTISEETSGGDSNGVSVVIGKGENPDACDVHGEISVAIVKLVLAMVELVMRIDRRTPDRETRVGSSAGSVSCFLEQETFTPQKYW